MGNDCRSRPEPVRDCVPRVDDVVRQDRLGGFVRYRKCNGDQERQMCSVLRGSVPTRGFPQPEEQQGSEDEEPQEMEGFVKPEGRTPTRPLQSDHFGDEHCRNKQDGVCDKGE